LQVLFAVEGNSLGFNFALLDVNFVAAEDNGDAFADSNEITWKYQIVRKVGTMRTHDANWERSYT
jgi:hypothetical protein